MNHRMNQRLATVLGAAALAIMVAAIFVAPSVTVGQVKEGVNAVTIATAKANAKPWVLGKTPDGQPDLQGYWTNNSIIPLQRPNGVTKEFYTQEEFLARAKQQGTQDDQQTTPGTTADVHYDFTQFGLDKSQTVIAANLRTSLITDPPNGKVPPVTAEGQKRAADIAAEKRAQGATYDKVQNIVIGSRCIYQGAGPPMLPPGYNPAYQIVQGPGVVMILIEAGHEVRTIRTDGSPHPPQNVRQWLGDSRGRWEGNTLVVETTNFNDKVNFQGASQNLKVTERFTRTDEQTIKYEFTVVDPATWSTPWSAELPFTQMDGPIFEHACHEGNYGIRNTLAAVRLEEKKAAEAAANGTAVPALPAPAGGRGAAPGGARGGGARGGARGGGAPVEAPTEGQ
jgi:hypothetical protein